MVGWWRERPTHEKWMIALIAALLIGIAVRWAWVSDEVAGALRDRFTAPTEQGASSGRAAPTDSPPQ